MYREDVQRFLFDNVLNFSFDMSKLTPGNVYNNIGYRSFQAQLAGFLFFNYLTGILFGLYGIYFGAIFGTRYSYDNRCCESCEQLIPAEVNKECFHNTCFDKCYCNPCRCESAECCDSFGYSKNDHVSYFSYSYFFGCCNGGCLIFQFFFNTYKALFPFRSACSTFCDEGCTHKGCICPQLLVAIVFAPIAWVGSLLLTVILFLLITVAVILYHLLPGLFVTMCLFFIQMALSVLALSITKIIVFMILYPFSFLFLREPTKISTVSPTPKVRNCNNGQPKKTVSSSPSTSKSKSTVTVCCNCVYCY